MNAKSHNNHLSISAACSLCLAKTEDFDHVFRQCTRSHNLWSYFILTLPPLTVSQSFRHWFTGLLQQQRLLALTVIWWFGGDKTSVFSWIALGLSILYCS